MIIAGGSPDGCSHPHLRSQYRLCGFQSQPSLKTKYDQAHSLFIVVSLHKREVLKLEKVFVLGGSHHTALLMRTNVRYIRKLLRNNGFQLNFSALSKWCGI